MNPLKQLMLLIAAIAFAVAGYFVGIEISTWAARTHPVNGWKPWYIGSGRHTSIRKERVSDTYGAIRLVGISSTTNIWDASMGRGPIELKKDQIYHCRCRLRGTKNNPVMISIFDSMPPHAKRGLQRCFTPGPDWQDYDFTFRANETCKASISLFVGAKSIEVDVAQLGIEPMEESTGKEIQQDSLAKMSRALSTDNWSMFPPANNGSTLHKGSGKDPEWIFKRSSQVVEGRSVDSVEYVVPHIPQMSSFLLNLVLSSPNANEAEVWFESNNGESSPHEVIALDKSKETISIPIFLKETTNGGTVFLRPTAKGGELCISKLWFDETIPSSAKQAISVRRLRLIKDEGVTAEIQRATDSGESIDVLTKGKGARVVRLDVPMSITAGSPGRIKVNVRSDRKKMFRMVIAQNHEPWDAIGEPLDVEINPESKLVELPFHAAASEPEARLVLSFDDAEGATTLSGLQLLKSASNSANEKATP